MLVANQGATGCGLPRFWENHWLWWTAPFVGGLTAGKLYTKFWMPKDQLPAAAKAAAKKLL